MHHDKEEFKLSAEDQKKAIEILQTTADMDPPEPDLSTAPKAHRRRLPPDVAAPEAPPHSVFDPPIQGGQACCSALFMLAVRVKV